MKKTIINLSVFTFLLSTAALSQEIKIIQQPDEFFENSSGAPIVHLIQSARSSLEIEVYTMNDPQVDQELRNAVNRGVKVSIVQEASPVGASCHPFGGSTAASSQTPDCLRQQDLVNFVNNKGGTYVPFSKTLCGSAGSRCYQHGKIAIVDHSLAMLSTGNFDTTSLCDVSAGAKSCDRDYSIISGDASIVNSIETVFKNDSQGKQSDFRNIDARLTISPNSMQPIVAFIGSAKRTLQIETQYLDDPTMNHAIVDASNRGVKVSIMVASACSFGTPKPSAVTKWNETYSSFDKAGIVTRIFDGAMKVGGMKGYLHAKAIIVDGAHAWVGSVNGSTTSLSDNREYGIFLDDNNLINQLDKFVSSDFNNNASESWQDSIVCKYEHGSH